MSSNDRYGLPQQLRLRQDLAYQFPQALTNFIGSFGAFYTVTGAYWESVVSFSFELQTSAVVATRNPTIEIRDANRIVVYSIPANQTQVASTAGGYAFLEAVASPWQPTSTFSVTPFPRFLMAPGWQLFFDTPGGQVADLYSGIYLVTERVPTGPTVSADTPVLPSPVAL